MNDTVVITGGAGGIGSACARAFAREGYRVALLFNHSRERAENLVAQLISEGSDAASFCADLRSFSEAHRVADDVLKRFGRADVLVNNAGISQIKVFGNITEQDWDNMMDSNVKTVFNCCSSFLPQMISRKAGRIVNISSMWGQQGASCEVHYSASKAAVIGMTKALAQELGLSGITVNCVAPGVIDTAMNSELNDDDIEALREEIPLYRIGTPAEVAEAVVFLASARASYITGQILGVNGGMVL